MKNKILNLVANNLKTIIPIWLILSILGTFYLVSGYIYFGYTQKLDTFTILISLISIFSLLSSPIWLNVALYNIFINRVISYEKKAVWLSLLLTLSFLSILGLSVGGIVTFFIIISVLVNLTFWVIILIFYKPKTISKLKQTLLIVIKSLGIIWLLLLLIISIIFAADYGAQSLVYFRNKIIMDNEINQAMFFLDCASRIRIKYPDLITQYSQQLNHTECTVSEYESYANYRPVCEKNFGKKYCETTHCIKDKAGQYTQDVIIKLKGGAAAETCILNVLVNKSSYSASDIILE